jgi:hypothetical protein
VRALDECVAGFIDPVCDSSKELATLSSAGCGQHRGSSNGRCCRRFEIDSGSGTIGWFEPGPTGWVVAVEKSASGMGGRTFDDGLTV